MAEIEMENAQKALTFAQILRRLLPFALRYPVWILVGVGTTVAGAILAQVEPFVMRFVIDNTTAAVSGDSPLTSELMVLGLAGGVLFGKQTLFAANTFFQRYSGERLRARVGADLSNAAFNKALGLRLMFFAQDANSPGRIVQRIDRGVEGLARSVKNVVSDLLPLFANAVVSLLVMFSVNVWVGTIAAGLIPIYFLLSWRQAQKQSGVRSQLQDLRESRTSSMFNSLLGIAIIKSFTRERDEALRMHEVNESIAEREIRHHRTNHIYDSVKEYADQAGAAIVVLFTAWLVFRGQQSVGAIALHLLLYRNVTDPIRHLHRIVDEHNEAVAFAQGYFALLETPLEEATTDHLLAVPGKRAVGRIEFRNVTFAYDSGDQVLHGLSMVLEAGKTTALIGLSGAGKTTAASLIPRFFEPRGGEILLDGQPLSSYPLEWVRRQVGVVLQRAHITSGSIEDNVRYGNPHATHEEILRAAEQSELTRVLSKSEGWAAPADRLAGGEQQRVAIARALVKDPSILILDEPTASLDVVATAQIKHALDELKRGRTVLIISHNLPMIMDADAIYVIKDGLIVEQGTHEQLMSQAGEYYALINSNVESMNLRRMVQSVEPGAQYANTTETLVITS
jgi:ABC-type multidrug transport system fused ATPase/permease subunit